MSSRKTPQCVDRARAVAVPQIQSSLGSSCLTHRCGSHMSTLVQARLAWETKSRAALHVLCCWYEGQKTPSGGGNSDCHVHHTDWHFIRTSLSLP